MASSEFLKGDMSSIDKRKAVLAVFFTLSLLNKGFSTIAERIVLNKLES